MKSRENRKQYWQEYLKAFNKSGLSQREYCRQADIGYWSFNQWKRRLEKETDKPFIEIASRPKAVSNENHTVTITVNNSVSISVPLPSFAQVFSEIMQVLDSAL